MLCKHKVGKQESLNPHPHLENSHFPPILNGYLPIVWNSFQYLLYIYKTSIYLMVTSITVGRRGHLEFPNGYHFF